MHAHEMISSYFFTSLAMAASGWRIKLDQLQINLNLNTTTAQFNSI